MNHGNSPFLIQDNLTYVDCASDFAVWTSVLARGRELVGEWLTETISTHPTGDDTAGTPLPVSTLNPAYPGHYGTGSDSTEE